MSGKARRPSGQPQKLGELLPRLLDEIGLSPYKGMTSTGLMEQW